MVVPWASRMSLLHSCSRTPTQMAPPNASVFVPYTSVWNYYRQSGPIYGEVGAPKRWEDTIAPWVETMGFV